MIRVRLKYKNGKLYLDSESKTLHRKFLNELKDGDGVFMFLEKYTPQSSASRLKFVHACIGEIAKETGATFVETKHNLKQHCGMIDLSSTGDIEKSFKDCSNKDYDLIVNTLIEWGRQLNINFENRLLD